MIKQFVIETFLTNHHATFIYAFFYFIFKLFQCFE